MLPFRVGASEDNSDRPSRSGVEALAFSAGGAVGVLVYPVPSVVLLV